MITGTGSSLLSSLLILLITAFGISWQTSQAFAVPPRNLAVSGDIDQVHVLAQNWTDEEANDFYNIPQGSKLIPYDWFIHLDQPDSSRPFLDAEHIRSLGYLPRTADSQGNPDGLPIGFVRDEDHLGLTCAACHTAQINRGREAWLIDGAPTLGHVEKLQRRLVDALAQTEQDNPKFERFARKPPAKVPYFT